MCIGIVEAETVNEGRWVCFHVPVKNPGWRIPVQLVYTGIGFRFFFFLLSNCSDFLTSGTSFFLPRLFFQCITRRLNKLHNT